MKTQLDCIPCFIRQALDAARHAGADETVQKMVLRRVCRWASEMDMAMTPPEMGQWIHRLVRERTGNADPYAQCKSDFNSMALKLLPELRHHISRSPDPFAAAVRLAIAGNAIDMGAYSGLDSSSLHQILTNALTSPVAGALEFLRAATAGAKTILYIADNAGEIVLDRLLIEQLGPPRVTVIVRGHPILNDATAADATAAGIDRLVEVIGNGSDAPGTLLPRCTPQVRHHFARADVVLAKGQGNYETLNEVMRPNVFFLLMAKCPVIAELLGCERNSLIVAQRHPPTAAPEPCLPAVPTTGG